MRHRGGLSCVDVSCAEAPCTGVRRGDADSGGVAGDGPTPATPVRGTRGLAVSLITLGVALVAAVVSGCATSVTGSGTAPSDQLALHSSEVSVSAASAHRHDATVALCRTATSSMVVMVKGYNDFLEALNRFHSYDKVGDLDDRARAALIAGADRIRDARDPEVPADLTTPVNTFLASTTRLEDAIGAHELTGLNPVATRWSTDKQAVLDVCARYLPPPPGIATRTSAVVPVPAG